MNLVLLVAKFLFLAILYVFVLMVVRSAARDLRRAAGSVAGGPPSSGAAGPGAPGGAFPAHSGEGAARAGATGWSLVVDSSPYLPRGWTHPLPYGSHTIIGRAPEADVVLADTFVSSRHARVTGDTGGVVVEDLGSTNGTLVGGREVEGSLFVAPGETLIIGDTVFLVEFR
ncbi:MAG: FHA domain-containing protein [Thermoleophilia bacterium]